MLHSRIATWSIFIMPTDNYLVALGLSERIDFVLREGSMENSYISAVTSHTSYWTNYDVSQFILSVLYPELQPASIKSDAAKP